MVAVTHFAIGSLAASAVYASPLSSSCKTYNAQLTNLAQEVPQAQHFCGSYLASKQTTSPIKGVSTSTLTKICQCATQDQASANVLAATPKGNAAGLAGAAAASVCKNVQLAKILSGIKNVQYFCSTFNPSQWQRGSPIWGVTAQAVQQACQCVLSAATASPLSPPAPSTTPAQTTAAPTPAPPAPAPAGPGQPFRFCPTNPAQIAPFKIFCKTPLWKAWACSCGSVAQVCYPNTQLTWCPTRPSSSSPSAPTPSSTTTIPAISSSSTTPAASPSSSSISTIPSTTTPAPTPSTTDAPITPSSSTDAPVVSSSTTDAPIVSSSTSDAPVVQSSSSSTDSSDGTSTTTADDSAPTS